MNPDLASIVLIPAAAVVAPLLSSLINRVVTVPLVVLEILLGILIGPSILGWVKDGAFTSTLANVGLAMLFFLAGNEIDFAAIRGRPMTRAGLGWLMSLAAGLTAGIVIAHSAVTGVFVGVALTSTALGTLMPVLRDAGELRTPFGRAVIAVGAAGEFGPLVAISLFLSGRSPLVSSAVLIAFVAIAAGGIWLASRGAHARLHRLITATLHTSGQFAVRLVILVLAALTCLSLALGLDMLLGAFAAGVLYRVLLSGAPPNDRATIETKVEAVGFGFLVPVFFVNTGVTFDLKSLETDPSLLLLLPLFLALFAIVRGLPGTLAAPRGATARDRGSLLLFSATGLPIIVAVTDIGVQAHDLSAGAAAALVGAGMLSVLVFPAVALALRRRSASGGSRAPDPDLDVPIEG